MTTRKDYYENAVYSLDRDDFERIFGVEPVDIMDFGYDFDRDVQWNYALEYAYNEYISEEDEEID